MATSNDQNKSEKCFIDWMKIQEVDLAELLQALTMTDNDKPPADVDYETLLTHLTQKILDHFQDYMDKRSQLAHCDVSFYFSPTWNSSLENSLLWLAGCRPSIYIRLIYALCGVEVESHLMEYLQGTRTGNLGDLSPEQLSMVNDLHSKTIKQEEKLSTELASLQEDIADDPISVIAKGLTQTGEPSEEVDRALHHHDEAMLHVLQEADKLRLNTLKELISILTPVQSVEYLAAGKKLHLCIHQWGKGRDLMHSRTN